jgi:hypothetical protein
MVLAVGAPPAGKPRLCRESPCHRGSDSLLQLPNKAYKSGDLLSPRGPGAIKPNLPTATIGLRNPTQRCFWHLLTDRHQTPDTHASFMKLLGALLTPEKDNCFPPPSYGTLLKVAATPAIATKSWRSALTPTEIGASAWSSSPLLETEHLAGGVRILSPRQCVHFLSPTALTICVLWNSSPPCPSGVVTYSNRGIPRIYTPPRGQGV